MNRGGGYDLEVPVSYYSTGPGKLIDWTKQKLKLCKLSLENKTKKSLK